MSCDAKEVSGRYAAQEFVKSGMTVGLGTGSTAAWAIRHLGDRARRGEISNIRCVCTSEASTILANKEGLNVVSMDEVLSDSQQDLEKLIDVAIDGADEIDNDKSIIKGRGGALLREKFVEKAATKFVVIVDQSKLVGRYLGKGPIPVEIVTYNYKTTVARIENAIQKTFSKKAELKMRMNKEVPNTIYVTDNGNYIVDVSITEISFAILDETIRRIVGVVETGIFLEMNPIVIVGNEDGSVDRLDPDSEGRSAKWLKVGDGMWKSNWDDF